MVSLLTIFYLLMLLFYIVTSIFIAYHLAKFALVSGVKFIVLGLFSFISIWLILSNMTIFFSIDWADLIYQLTNIS